MRLLSMCSCFALSSLRTNVFGRIMQSCASPLRRSIVPGIVLFLRRTVGTVIKVTVIF